MAMCIRLYDQSNFEEFIRTTQILSDSDFLNCMNLSKESMCIACWKIDWPDLTCGGVRIREIYRDHTVPLRARGNPRSDEFFHFPTVYVTRRLVENIVCRGWFESMRFMFCDCAINVETFQCKYGHGLHVMRPCTQEEEAETNSLQVL
jgi:hypothetical protein